MAENVKNDTYLEEGNLAEEEIADTRKEMNSFLSEASVPANVTETGVAESSNLTTDSLNSTEPESPQNQLLASETNSTQRTN
jgi:hypothetical protein